MLLNKSIEYSIKILTYLIHVRTNYRLNAEQIADAIKLPKEFTSKILQVLAKHNIVSSQRGRGGGFKIIKSSDAIVLGELIEMFNNKNFLSSCWIGLNNNCIDCNCPMYKNWMRLKKQMYESKIIEIKSTNTFYS